MTPITLTFTFANGTTESVELPFGAMTMTADFPEKPVGFTADSPITNDLKVYLFNKVLDTNVSMNRSGARD